MPHIQQLGSHVADLIAAGEVVERPASVVKELVENAIDAGSSAVTVEIQNGGMRLIRVTDNGCGIAAEELPTAFLRHATSKLRSEEDLARIGTLGFRGEALAAISAVSRVEITSCPRGGTGASLRLEGGVPDEVRPAGAPEGTVITARDLFFNTPARLKFMKKDSAETAAVSGLVQHLALSHPEVSFRLLKDGAEALHTPGDGRLDSAVYAALGRDFARTLTPVKGRGGDTAVSGFVTKPLCGRGSRGMQSFFVNGRFIKSQLLTAALEEGYRNQIMKGKFPGCVLLVTLPVTAVDVNVHPAKTQVKFVREKEVFDAVYHTVLDCLAEDGTPKAAAPAPAQAAPPRQDFYQAMDTAAFHSQYAGGTPPARPAEKKPARGWDTEQGGTLRVADSAPRPGFAYASGRHQAAPRQTGPERPGQPSLPSKPAAPARPVPAPPRPFVPAIPAEPETGQMVMEPLRRETPWRIAGEVLNTYIICEDGQQNIWLIDKHAAHERVNFDRLMASKEPPMRQTLLKPLAAELSREDGALLLENLPLLEDLGFACEDFGGGAVLVREIPADIAPDHIASTLEELAEELRRGRSPAERREALLRTMACKASIKAGMHSDEKELRTLVDRVQSGEIQYCPHGRPVKVKISRYELEKMFKRA